MIWGTKYFASFASACMYYSSGNEDMSLEDIINMVNEKVQEGNVFIGEPEVADGEELVLLDEGTRYGIKT
jgi:hypothetical protein